MGKKWETNEFWKQIIHLLLDHLRYKRKFGTPTIEEVAERHGVEVVTIYKILQGNNHIKVADFPRFYNACGKPFNVLASLVRACEPSVVMIPRDERIVDGSMSDEIEELTIRLGQFIDKKREALKDGRIDIEEGDILAEIIAVMMGKLHRLLSELGVEIGKKGGMK